MAALLTINIHYNYKLIDVTINKSLKRAAVTEPQPPAAHDLGMSWLSVCTMNQRSATVY